MLFLHLGKENRKSILSEMCQLIENLITNRYGQCSVLFILENKLSEDEKNMVLDYLKPKMPIIALFPFSRIRYILEYSIERIDYFLEIKEGYFFIKMIIKSCKDSQIQDLLLKKMTCNLMEFILNPNGLLICLSFIYNIPLKRYTFIKSCSKHLINEESLEDEKKEDYDMKNCHLISFILVLIENLKLWDNFSLRKIVLCAIEVSNKSFLKVLFNKYTLIQRKLMFKDLLLLQSGQEILMEMKNSFKSKYFYLIIYECNEVIKGIKELVDNSIKKYIYDVIRIKSINTQSESKYSVNPYNNSNTYPVMYNPEIYYPNYYKLQHTPMLIPSFYQPSGSIFMNQKLIQSNYQPQKMMNINSFQNEKK